jgi:hypothetical protein
VLIKAAIDSKITVDLRIYADMMAEMIGIDTKTVLVYAKVKQLHSTPPL